MKENPSEGLRRLSMRKIHNSIFDCEASAIGFGCASLGSRIAPKDGLRSLEYAYDLGVNWFDVAPPYGDGQAEAILGSFLKGRRDKVIVCSKVGIARPNISSMKRLLRYPARWAVRQFPQIRGYVSGARPVGARPTITPSMIRNSVEGSLRQLNIDYLDVLALHEPSIEDCENSGVLEALHNIRSNGLARTISIAGSIEPIAAGFAASSLFEAAQFPDNPFSQNLRTMLRGYKSNPPFFITHSVFDPSSVRRLQRLVAPRGTQIGDDDSGPTRLLIDYALASNPTGTVVLSMYSREHITENCSRASRAVDVSIVKKVDDLIALEAEHQQARSAP